MTRLHSELDSTRPVAVVRLRGPLELVDAPAAWNLLVKLLADQPDAMVVDLSALTVEDPQALLMFGALARRAGVWPGVPVILVAPTAGLRDPLKRQAVDRQVAICGTRDEAMVLAHGAPLPLRLRESLLPDPGAARQARDLATEACLRWQLPDLVGSASIISSELVTNAVRHAGTPMVLSLARTARYLYIAVRDQDPRPAVLQPPDLLATSGRGLLIVQRTALSWGSAPAHTGKVVWATLLAEDS
jgi:anti-sigma regulatory factor (Ser/Thr protein kinase)